MLDCKRLKILLLVVLGLSVGGAAVLNAKLRVVVTTTMLTDMARDIGGAEIDLVGLMGAGVDPHSYRPSRGDVLAMQRADIIFYNGHHLEGRMIEVLERMGKRGQSVIAVAEGIPSSHWMESDEGGGVIDPHLWFDPAIWALGIDVVVDGLSAKDGANSALYQQRGAELKQLYLELADWAKQQLQEIPEGRRILVTSHDAFGYFGRAFSFQVVGLQGISTVSEAGLGDVQRLAEFLRERGVKAVFVESSLSPKLMERVSELAGVRVGGLLFSDAMGMPGEFEEHAGERVDLGTFKGMFKHNIHVIVEGLK